MRKSNQSPQSNPESDPEIKLEFVPSRIRVVEAEELTTSQGEESKRRRSALVQHFQKLADQIDEDIERILKL